MPSKTPIFVKGTKQKNILKVINEALFIINKLGIPFKGLSERRLEKMAMSFLACIEVKRSSDWKNAKDSKSSCTPSTRQIITYINNNFDEKISSGSYDDIRRKDLKLLVTADIIIRSAQDPNAATNNPTRGYALNPEYINIIQSFGKNNWTNKVDLLLIDRELLSEKFEAKRKINKVTVKTPNGETLVFSPGEHNILQKAIIEDLLPRYGYGSEVLYVGDTSNKYLSVNKEKLKELKFFDIAHEELPDVISYSSSRNWLYLIEAVHSSGPINNIRLEQLKKLTKPCTAEIIYITAFLNRVTFRKFAPEIAWETEVWIADAPDHLIHFNGDKFLGPYKG